MTMPDWKPPPVEKLGLQGPPHAAATYCVPLMVTASSELTCDAAFPPSALRTSKMFCQSVEAPVPEVVPAMPASEFHTIAPPATRWLGLVRSMLIYANDPFDAINPLCRTGTIPAASSPMGRSTAG